MNYESLVKAIKPNAYTHKSGCMYLIVDQVNYTVWDIYGRWSSSEELAWKSAYLAFEEEIIERLRT